MAETQQADYSGPMVKPVFVLNGPNLNLLGEREPEIYGSATLDDIRAMLEGLAGELGLSIEFRQSNREGELVEWLQEARGAASAVIINAAGYGHTSVAIRDALSMLDLPAIDVHLSNVYAREEFRHHSFLSGVVKGTIAGFGPQSYLLALRAVHALANPRRA